MLSLSLLLMAATFEPTGGVAVSCLENLRGKVGRARVEVVVAAGAVHEGEAERGVAHLLEHLVLRPLGFDDGNGATGWDYTTYHRDVRADELIPAAEDLLKELRSPKLTAEDVAVEKRIVLRELEVRGTSHAETQEDPIFRSTVYARYPGGSADAVRDLEVGDISSFHGRHYVRGNIAVLLRGAVDCKAARLAIEPILHDFPSGPVSQPPNVQAREPGRLAVPTSPGNFMAGFYWYSATPADEVLYRVIAKHLERRALTELRKDRGLTYSPSASFLRRGRGGQIMLTVQTKGEESAVDEWYKEELQQLLLSSTPRSDMAESISAVRTKLETDGVRAGLAALHKESSQLALLGGMTDTDMRVALPPLLSEARAFGSAVPQSNIASLIILGLFGALVLGALFYAYRAYN